MNGGGCCTTRTWPPPSSTGSWNEEDSSASMDPRDGHVISNWRTPCQTVQNGSEYLEKTAQNFRNPQHHVQSPLESTKELRRDVHCYWWAAGPCDTRNDRSRHFHPCGWAEGPCGTP